MTDKHTAHSVVDWTGYLYHEEVDALIELARSLPQDAHIINIGAGNGTSGLAFMEARSDLRVTTIDIQLESSPYGCLAGEEAVFRSAGFWGDPRHEQIHGDSKDVAFEWIAQGRNPVHMVFIDGGHQYHEAIGDIYGWRPLIMHGGILAIHDYEKTHKVWHGVDRAVNEYRAKLPQDIVISQVKTLIAMRVDATPLPPMRRMPRAKRGAA